MKLLAVLCDGPARDGNALRRQLRRQLLIGQRHARILCADQRGERLLRHTGRKISAGEARREKAPQRTDAARRLNVLSAQCPADCGHMQPHGQCHILHGHRYERTFAPEIGRLETQNFLAAAQERLFTLRDAVDDPFGLGELLGQILPDLRIFALVPRD